MNRLKELRKEKKLTQKELADVLKINEKTISRWENNESTIKSNKAETLANFFGVSMGYLLGFTDNSKIYEDEVIVGDPDSIFPWSRDRFWEEEENSKYLNFVRFFIDSKLIIPDNVIDSLYQLIKAQDIGLRADNENLSPFQLSHLITQDYDGIVELLSQNGYSYIYSDQFKRTKTEYLIHRYVIAESQTEAERGELLQILKKHYGERPRYEKDYKDIH